MEDNKALLLEGEGEEKRKRRDARDNNSSSQDVSPFAEQNKEAASARFCRFGVIQVF